MEQQANRRMEQQAEKKVHVVLLPWNQHSHITPIFALGRALARRGLLVTGALPASRYSSYVNDRSIDGAALFRVERIEEAAALGDGGRDFYISYKKVEQGFQQLLHRLQPRPTCLIVDILYSPWPMELADRLSIPCFKFSVFSAISCLICARIPQLLREGLLPFHPDMKDKVIDWIPGFNKGFRIADAPMDFLGRSAEELETLYSNVISRRSAGLVINASYALEAETLDALAPEIEQIYPVGPMSSIDWMSIEVHRDSLLNTEEEECLQWLDGQPSGSVVYASFGSIISLTEEDILGLAMGLEACGQPFLWVVRSVAGSVDPKSALPPGFIERNKGRGHVVSWAPQAAVLLHPSVGCFLCHCGYSSVLEALWAGVPILGGFYKISDQNTMFKLIADTWGVGMSLSWYLEGGDRRKEGGWEHLGDSIEAGIKELMHGGERRVAIKQRCAQMKAAIREAAASGGASERSLDKLVAALLLEACIDPPG